MNYSKETCSSFMAHSFIHDPHLMMIQFILLGKLLLKLYEVKCRDVDDGVMTD